jgi:hypothetical protein
MAIKIIIHLRPADKGDNIVSPDEFLQWAWSDLKGSDKRNRGNAIGNVKRAIHSKLDEIVEYTYVRYTSDWPIKPSTENKLEVLKQLRIEYRSIVKIITDTRNEYERQYVIPDLDTVRAFCETAELWLNTLKAKYKVYPLGIAGLEVASFGWGGGKSGERITSLKFAAPSEVLYFDRSQRQLVQLYPNGTKEVNDFGSYRWKDLLRIEKPYIFALSNAVSQETLSEIIERYEHWLKAHLHL